MHKIRLLIADDHRVVRAGLRALFKSSPEFVVVGEAANGEEVIRRVARFHPDVVLLDLSMPVMNGIEVTRKLREGNDRIRILILTIHAEREYIREVMFAGANGYVLKSAEKREIFAAVKTVAVGGRFFSHDVSQVMIDGFMRHPGPPAERPPDKELRVLSKRESEVLQLIAAGCSSPEIARKLSLSVHTINTHRNNLMHKLGIHDIAGLVRYALQTGSNPGSE